MAETLKYGDKVDQVHDTIMMTEFIDVSPIRYDGINEAHVVCAQDSAQYMLIRGIDLGGNIIHILLPCNRSQNNCKNTHLLADAIQE